MTSRSHPPSTTVRLWHATSSSDQPGPVESTCQAWLDEEERLRANRFRMLTCRNQNVVGRGMARRLLSSDAVTPESIRFATAEHGKPFVVEPDAAKQPFNVAHTIGLVMCGVGSSAHAMLGVDVERLERRTDPDLADRYFSEPEIRYLDRHQSRAARKHAFLRVWTLKESFIKAIGTGLQTPLADFAFMDIDSDSPTIKMLSPKLDSDRAWKFYSIQPRAGFISAIAVATDDHETKVDLVVSCFDDLIGE